MVSLPRKCKHCSALIYHYSYCSCVQGRIEAVRDERKTLKERSAELDEIERALTDLTLPKPAVETEEALSEEERHAIAHARHQVERSSDENPECRFDYDLVKDLLRVIDRAFPDTTTHTAGRLADQRGR